MDASRDLEQLREPLRYLSSHAQKKRDDAERLRRELAEAEKKLERFETDYEKTLAHYARTDCRQLATMMYERLPQEVRETVYEYICVDPDRLIPVGPYYHFRPYDRPYTYPPQSEPDADADSTVDWLVGGGPRPESNTPIEHVSQPQGTSTAWDYDVQIDPELAKRISDVHIEQDMDNQSLGNNCTILLDGRTKEVHTHKPPSDIMLPSSHVLDPRYVGPEVAHEMQKLYYASNTFSVCTVEKGISSFLGFPVGCSTLKPVDGPPNDSSSLGPLPPLFAAEHIRKFQVRVKLEHFLLDKPETEYDFDSYAYEQRFLRKTCNDLEGLNDYFKRRPKGAVDIEFVMMTKLPKLRHNPPLHDYYQEKHEQDRIYVNFLQCIRNAVYKTMYDNEDVSVKVTHYDPDFSPFPRNITRLFALTKEQWEYEKSKQKDNPNWEADFFLMRRLGVDLRDMPGMYDEDMNQLLVERWGMSPNATSLTTRHAIKEGRFWPVAVMQGETPTE